MQLVELEPVVREMIEQAESEHATAFLDQEIPQASESPGVAGESSSGGEDSALRSRSARMRTLRKRGSGDRLRGEFPVGCGARKAFCAGYETRNGLAGRVGKLGWFRHHCRRESPRSAWRVTHRHRHGHQQILQSRTASSAERDLGEGPRLGNQPRSAGRLGPQSPSRADRLTLAEPLTSS